MRRAATPAQALLLPAANLPEASARLDVVLGAMALRSFAVEGDAAAAAGGGGSCDGDAVRAGLGISSPVAQQLESYLRSLLGPPPQRSATAFGLFCEHHKANVLIDLRQRQDNARAELAALRAAAAEQAAGAADGALSARIQAATSALEALMGENLVALLKSHWEGLEESARADFHRREQEQERSWLEQLRAYEERLTQALRVAALQGACLQAASAQARAVTGGAGGAGAAAAAPSDMATEEEAAAPAAVLPHEALWSAAMLRPRARVLDRAAAAAGGWWSPGAGAGDEAGAGAAAGGDAASPKSRDKKARSRSAAAPSAAKAVIAEQLQGLLEGRMPQGDVAALTEHLSKIDTYISAIPAHSRTASQNNQLAAISFFRTHASP